MNIYRQLQKIYYLNCLKFKQIKELQLFKFYSTNGYIMQANQNKKKLNKQNKKKKKILKQ